MSWVEFWSAPEHDHLFWKKSIAYYVENLAHLIQLKPSQSVLDFGAGPGYLAELLGPIVGEMELIEPSPELRAIARGLPKKKSNITIHDYNQLSDLPHLLSEQKFDLIIVNSVLQYVSITEIKSLFELFKESLKEDGVLIVSDIIPAGTWLVRELYYVFRFYLKWFGIKAFLWHLLNEFRLGIQRTQQKLTTFTPQTFETLAQECFCIKWVSNPTICKNRYAAVLSLKNPS